MAEETEFAMGATASCADGPGGKVSRVIIDPATETVTHLVIEPKHRLGVGRLVPLNLVDTTAGDIRLRCTGELDYGGTECGGVLGWPGWRRPMHLRGEQGDPR